MDTLQLLYRLQVVYHANIDQDGPASCPLPGITIVDRRNRLPLQGG
jgi:hypothetical protein